MRGRASIAAVAVRARERPGPGRVNEASVARQRADEAADASLNAAGRSRLARCVAPASRTRRTSRPAAANVGADEPEGQVELAVEDQRRARVGGQPRDGTARRRRRAGPARRRRPEPAGDDRLGDRPAGSVARKNQALSGRAGRPRCGPSRRARARYGSVRAPTGSAVAPDSTSPRTRSGSRAARAIAT